MPSRKGRGKLRRSSWPRPSAANPAAVKATLMQRSSSGFAPAVTRSASCAAHGRARAGSSTRSTRKRDMGMLRP